MVAFWTGVSMDVVAEHMGVPVLGVCLGMQALAHANGAAVIRGPEPVHGRLSSVRHAGHPLFRGIPSGDVSHPSALSQSLCPGMG